MSAATFVTIAILSAAALAFVVGWVAGSLYEQEKHRDYDRRTMQGLRRIAGPR